MLIENGMVIGPPLYGPEGSGCMNRSEIIERIERLREQRLEKEAEIEDIDCELEDLTDELYR